MSANRDMASLLDILQAAQQIQRYTTGVSLAHLEADEEKQTAILYRIIIIGEATKRISAEFRAQQPQIPWKDVAGMRELVSHDGRLDLTIVWGVVHTRIPQLIALIEPLIPPP